MRTSTPKKPTKQSIHSDLSDSQLLELYRRSQNTVYFDHLYRRYKGKVYSKCISLLKNENSAQDALQEIFLKIFLNLSKFNENAKFSTWVYSITYNFCIDILRRRKKDRKIFTDEIEGAPDIADDVPDKMLLELEVSRLKKVLDGIPEGDKAILLMKYQDDLKIKDIAEILNKTESAIKMKIKRAKHKAKRKHMELFPKM